jgi:membrane protease subunit (stomatin/prohibitin family)
LASAHAHAKADATREQLHEKARATDYVSQVDMRAGSTLKAPAAGASRGRATRKCVACDAEVGQAKFCPECGTPTAPPRPSCTACGHEPEGSPKFCPECGGKMNAK